VSNTARRQVERETGDVVKAVVRMIRAVGRRVGTEDVEDLSLLVALVDESERQLQQAVSRLREQGRSWSEIGRGLGVSKQAAQQRFGGSRAVQPGLHAVPDQASRTC
jgi:hypothetical protein